MNFSDFISALVVGVFYGLPLVLATIPAWRARSWRLLLLGIPKVFFGIYVPLLLFVFSAVLAPDLKGEAALGWLSLFCFGKLILLPLVLWALAGFYAVEVCQVANRHRPWIVLGYFQGAVVASVCLLSGVEWLLKPYEPLVWWLAVPTYVATYFTLRTVQFVEESDTSPWTLVKAWLAGTPLWGGAIYLSWTTFSQLPDKVPQRCFVVTAAARGHARLVGPFVPHTRHGRLRPVNRQLLTFWAFEQSWETRSPRSHRAFRAAYNVVGRRLARCLCSPWLADAAYLALKPAEWFASFVLSRK